jgi:hypothetical protein
LKVCHIFAKKSSLQKKAFESLVGLLLEIRIVLKTNRACGWDAIERLKKFIFSWIFVLAVLKI